MCVRNLPPSFNDRQLKKLSASHCAKSAVITEAKVIMEGGGGNGKANSKGNNNKGYGFVRFTKHEDALQVN